jgi:hypothetical protein
MKYLLTIVLGCAIVISSSVFAGDKNESNKQQTSAEGKKIEQPAVPMCDMKVTGKLSKIEIKGKNVLRYCLTTADGEEVAISCKDKVEEVAKYEGKQITITGKGIEKKGKEGKSHKMIKVIEKIEEAPSAPAPEK